MSHVCRHWRTTALSCAKLWTIVVLDERIHPEFIQLLLDRSSGLSLTAVLHVAQEDHCPTCISTEEAPYNYDCAIDVFKRILPAIRILKVFVAKEKHAELWKALRRLRRATKLEDLHIEAVEYVRFTRSRYQRGASVVVPHEISSQIPTSLRSVKLCGVGFAWSNTLLCATLRHLHVSSYQSLQGKHLSALLAALNNMPHLESFRIDVLPPSILGSEPPRVALPSLQRLEIPLKQAESAVLLLHLDLPRTASVLFFDTRSLHAAFEKEPEVDPKLYTDIAGAIASLLDGTNVYALSQVRNESGYSLDLPLCSLWTTSPSKSLDGPPPPWRCMETTPPQVAVRAALNSPVMEAILARLDLSYVETMKIDADCETTARHLIESVRAAKNLSALHISGEIALPLGAVLSGWSRFRDAEELARVSRPYNDRADETDPLPDWYGFGDVADDVWGDPAVEDAIEEHRDRYRPCGGPYPLFPRLRTLVVAEVDFLHTDREDTTFGRRSRRIPFLWACYGVPYGLDAKALAKSLRLRRGQGVSEVVRLEFMDCQCSKKEELLPLFDVVQEIVWNGRQLTAHNIQL